MYTVNNDGLVEEFNAIRRMLSMTLSESAWGLFDSGWRRMLAGEMKILVRGSDSEIKIICPNENSLRCVIYALKIMLKEGSKFKNHILNEDGFSPNIYQKIQATMSFPPEANEKEKKSTIALWPRNNGLINVTVKQENRWFVVFRSFLVDHLLHALPETLMKLEWNGKEVKKPHLKRNEPFVSADPVNIFSKSFNMDTVTFQALPGQIRKEMCLKRGGEICRAKRNGEPIPKTAYEEFGLTAKSKKPTKKAKRTIRKRSSQNQNLFVPTIDKNLFLQVMDGVKAGIISNKQAKHLLSK